MNSIVSLQLDLQVPTGWQTAIALDTLQNSHPIDQEVDTPSEIDELFDAISYNKVRHKALCTSNLLLVSVENDTHTWNRYSSTQTKRYTPYV